MTGPIVPMPPFTPAQQKIEREAANLTEALQLLDTFDAAAPSPWSALAERVAAALTAAEDRGPGAPRVVPELLQVTGWPDAVEGPRGNDPDWLPSEADGPERHGLQCPHCGVITWDGADSGIYVIDVSERWSRFGYEVLKDQPVERYEQEQGKWVRTGERADEHRVVGGYADGEHHGAGYACETCERRVALPDGVEEVGN